MGAAHFALTPAPRQRKIGKNYPLTFFSTPKSVAPPPPAAGSSCSAVALHLYLARPFDETVRPRASGKNDTVIHVQILSALIEGYAQGKEPTPEERGVQVARARPRSDHGETCTAKRTLLLVGQGGAHIEK